MKKINLTLFITLMVYSFSSYSQENILPTTGKVGIGTLNPSAKLDVNGKMHVDSAIWLKGEVKMSGVQEVENQPAAGGGNGNGNGNNNNAGNASPQQYKYLVIGEDGVVKRGKEIIIGPPGTPTGPGDTDDTPCNNINASKWDKALNKLFVNCPNVNVGINTNNPRVKLDVIGTTYSQKLALGSINPVSIGNTNLYVKSAFSAASNNKIAVFENTVGEVLTLKTNGDLETKRIIANGDVDVFGKNSINGSMVLNSNLSSLTGVVFGINKQDNTKLYEFNQDGTFRNYGRTYIYTGKDREDQNVSTAFTIWANNGKLLQVNSDGLMLCREIKLNQTWADYVFDKNYQLMPLKEVEQFILKNKHLPNVPSAKTIELDGITVNETNRILLEKIEELTLYLIQQQKEIEELKNVLNK
jgi:hypothetical protein